MGVNTCILLVVGIIGAIFTFFVNEKLGQGPVRSSAGLSLLVASFFLLFPHSLDAYLVKNIPPVFIGSSFIGMVSTRLLSSYLKIGLAGIIFASIYLNTSLFFNGYGGALGTTASISLLVVLSLPVLNLRGNLTNGFSQLTKVIYNSRNRINKTDAD